MLRFYIMAWILMVGFLGCGDRNDPFASASYRLQRTQLKRDIEELEKLRKQYPYQMKLYSELKRMKKELQRIEEALQEGSSNKSK